MRTAKRGRSSRKLEKCTKKPKGTGDNNASYIYSGKLAKQKRRRRMVAEKQQTPPGKTRLKKPATCRDEDTPSTEMQGIQPNFKPTKQHEARI